MSERGEQAIALPAHELRKLCRLPDEVDIVCALPDPTMSHHPPEWRSGDYDSLIYLKIRSQYAFRIQPRSILAIETLDDFLERYRGLRERARQVESAVKPEVAA
jgi:hypothetical protein